MPSLINTSSYKVYKTVFEIYKKTTAISEMSIIKTLWLYHHNEQ
jgi:hypothetical protein